MVNIKRKYLAKALIIILAVIIGVATLHLSRAAVPTIATEAENGLQSGCTQRKFDLNSSKYYSVKFSTPGNCLAPAMVFDATRSTSTCSTANGSIQPNPTHNIFKISAGALDDCGVTPLTTSTTTENWWPRVSHDGTKILYYQTPAGVYEGSPNAYSQTSLHVMNRDGTGDRLLIASGRYWSAQGHAEWSPDGSQIVMFGGDPVPSGSNLYGYQIYIIDSDGNNVRQVTKRLAHGATDPSWSPDGQTIIFAGCPDQVLVCVDNSADILTVPASSSNATTATRIVMNDLADADPYFSPDGTLIAWIGKANTTTDSWGLYLVGATARDVSGFILVEDGNINSKPEWAADSNTIYFHRYIYGQTPAVFHIYSVDHMGQNLKPIFTYWKSGFNANYDFPSLLPD